MSTPKQVTFKKNLELGIEPAMDTESNRVEGRFGTALRKAFNGISDGSVDQLKSMSEEDIEKATTIEQDWRFRISQGESGILKPSPAPELETRVHATLKPTTQERGRTHNTNKARLSSPDFRVRSKSRRRHRTPSPTSSRDPLLQSAMEAHDKAMRDKFGSPPVGDKYEPSSPYQRMRKPDKWKKSSTPGGSIAPPRSKGRRESQVYVPASGNPFQGGQYRDAEGHIVIPLEDLYP